MIRPPVPEFAWLPHDHRFSDGFLETRSAVLTWIADSYNREHQIRAADWILHVEADASEAVIIAALTHDIERSVPGGPELDMARSGWDDAVYIEAHSRRSGDLVRERLREHGADPGFIAQVRDAVLQHEFGGTEDGNLAQAGDSLSYLEVLTEMTAGWAIAGRCSADKARAKLDWMYSRIRHPVGRKLAAPIHARAIGEFDRRIQAAGL